MTETSEQPAPSAFTVTAFPRKEAETAFPVNVTAPVVVDAKSEAGTRDFLAFFDGLSRHSNAEVAAAEARRIDPYFSAMSLYLTRALDRLAPESELTAARDPLREAVTPGGLHALFNAMAGFTRSTIISDVVVLSDEVRTEGPAQHLFANWREFKTDYNYGGHKFNFGFLQAFEGGKKTKGASGTTFPTFMIDHRLVALLPEAEAAPIARGLQAVMTLVNHDMLHHFTSTYINTNTVYADGQSWRSNDPTYQWGRKIPHFGYGEAYEEWAMIGQEKVILQPENAELIDGARARIDDYFDRLERARDALLAPGGTAEEEADAQRQKAHEVVDYFGMVMAHALCRVFPLNDPLLVHCLERLQKADPAPERAAEDCLQSLSERNTASGKTTAEALAAIRNLVGRNNKLMPQMVKGYRELGFECYPEDDAAVGHAHLKMLQLMKLGGLHNHVPADIEKDLTAMRAAADERTLDMVASAVKTAFPALPPDMKTRLAGLAPPPSETEKALREFGVEFRQRADGLLIVPGDLDLSNRGLETLPDLRDVIVEGSFRCNGNKLTNAENGPRSVGKDYDCSDNQITTLSGLPREIPGSLLCRNNQVRYISYGPERIGGDFDFSNNKVTAFDERLKSVGGEILARNNPLETLDNAPKGFRALRCDKGDFASWHEAVALPHIKAARELFEALRAGKMPDGHDARSLENQVQRELRAAQSDAAALDPAGAKTAGEMDGILSAALAAAHLEQARQFYARLRSRDTAEQEHPDQLANNVRSELRAAKADAAALDPSGKRNAAAMEQELNEAVSARHVDRARLHFGRLVVLDLRNYSYPEYLARDAREELQAAGKDSAALDASGVRTAAQMQKMMDDAVSAWHIARAREFYAQAVSGPLADLTRPMQPAQEARDQLKTAGVGCAALDPTGQASDEEMDKAFGDAVAARQVDLARTYFMKLRAGDKGGFNDPEYAATSIRKWLAEVKASEAALDPAGRKTAEEMGRELDGAVLTVHLAAARKYFGELAKGKIKDTSDADRTERRIRSELAEAKADLRALNPAGRTTAAAMDKRLKNMVASVHIGRARKLFTALAKGKTEGFSSGARMAREIMEEIKATGRDLTALNRRGSAKTAEQLETEMQAAVRRVDQPANAV